MHATAPILFDRLASRKYRARRAADFPAHDFLHREVAARMADMFEYIARPFPTILELGAQSDALALALEPRAGTTQYIACDCLPSSHIQCVADEEWLPFGEACTDAVVSNLALHGANDLPGVLAQIHRSLRPDGFMMLSVAGGETLHELRATFAAVEARLSGGVRPRVAPFIDVRDAGALLQRAGFALPVADSERITITYPNLFALMADLRGSGQANLLAARARHFTARRFFMEAATHYATHYSDPEGQITATVEVITLSGWKPDASQQQPARRGSGKVSLAEALKGSDR